jgi:hypothetical protein
VGLATDTGGGSSFSMLRTMNAAHKVARMGGYHLTALRMFYLATRAPADALGCVREQMPDLLASPPSTNTSASDFVSPPMAAFRYRLPRLACLGCWIQWPTERHSLALLEVPPRPRQGARSRPRSPATDRLPGWYAGCSFNLIVIPAVDIASAVWLPAKAGGVQGDPRMCKSLDRRPRRQTVLEEPLLLHPESDTLAQLLRRRRKNVRPARASPATRLETAGCSTLTCGTFLVSFYRCVGGAPRRPRGPLESGLTPPQAERWPTPPDSGSCPTKYHRWPRASTTSCRCGPRPCRSFISMRSPRAASLQFGRRRGHVAVQAARRAPAQLIISPTARWPMLTGPLAGRFGHRWTKMVSHPALGLALLHRRTPGRSMVGGRSLTPAHRGCRCKHRYQHWSTVLVQEAICLWKALAFARGTCPCSSAAWVRRSGG